MTKTIPTTKLLLDIRTRTLNLSSSRLIQMLDSRNAALKLLEPTTNKKGEKVEPNVPDAIEALKSSQINNKKSITGWTELLKAVVGNMWDVMLQTIELERHDHGLIYRYTLVPVKHCKDKPCIEYPNGGAKCWFLNNKRHRINGPAIDFGEGHERNCYYIKGKEMTKEEYENRDKSKDGFAPDDVVV